VTPRIGNRLASVSEACRSATRWALVWALTIAGPKLMAQDQTSVSWVPYQIGCPIRVLALETDRTIRTALFEVQNVSSDAVEEITVGALAGIPAGGRPRPLAASRTVSMTIAPGERRRISLEFDLRDALPITERREEFLITFGVVQVCDRGGVAWVSPVTIAGEFKAVNWLSTEQAHARRPCQDQRRRLYPTGAVLFDERHVAKVCQADGAWGPR
jgi:hypothetical protein